MSICRNCPGKYKLRYVSVVACAVVEVLMLGYSQGHVWQDDRLPSRNAS